MEDLPSDLRSVQHLREVGLHTIEVDGDGEGDEIDIVMPDGTEWCPEAQKEQRKEPEEDDEVVLREQFKCVIQAALNKHRSWVDGNEKHWPCAKADPSRRPEEEPPLCLVFYFNGGLNSKTKVMQTAATTYRTIEEDGMYPIYMIWPTGGTESYVEDVARVRSGRLNDWPNEWDDWNEAEDWTTVFTTPFRPASDLLRGLASTPAAWATSLFEFYQTGLGFGSKRYTMKQDGELHVNRGKPIAAGENVEIHQNQNLYFSSWEKDFDLQDPNADPDGSPKADLLVQNGAGARAEQAGRFFYHGATAPIRALSTAPMVGFGEAGWRNMVRRTRTSVRSAAEFPDEFADEDEDDSSSKDQNSIDIAAACDRELQNKPEKLRRCYPRGSGGFARVFQWLESCMTDQVIGKGADDCPLKDMPEADLKALRNARIVMIGHSMGTIVINELLQLFPELPYESLVYMAGAASVRETARAVTPILVNNRGCTKFYGLMLHPMNEARESNKYGLLPSGSLLTYVDEFLEVPKTVPDRTVGQWRNLRATRHMFSEVARRWMLFHVFDRAEGDNGKGYPNPTTHGAFNDDKVPFWREAFWKPEKVAFAQPKADCKEFFTSRLVPAEIPEEAIKIKEWQRVLQEVQMGKTFVVRGENGFVARIIPGPASIQEDAAGSAH